KKVDVICAGWLICRWIRKDSEDCESYRRDSRHLRRLRPQMELGARLPEPSLSGSVARAKAHQGRAPMKGAIPRPWSARIGDPGSLSVPVPSDQGSRCHLGVTDRHASASSLPP